MLLVQFRATLPGSHALELPHGSRPAPVLLCRTLYILAWEFVVCSTTRTVRSARVYVYFVLLGASMPACFHSLGRCTELPLLLHYLGLLALIVVAALRASFVCTLCVRMSLPFGKCVFTYTHMLFPCVCIFPPVGRYHVSLSDSNQFLKHRCRITFPHVRVCRATDNTYACT